MLDCKGCTFVVTQLVWELVIISWKCCGKEKHGASSSKSRRSQISVECEVSHIDKDGVGINGMLIGATPLMMYGDLCAVSMHTCVTQTDTLLSVV